LAGLRSAPFRPVGDEAAFGPPVRVVVQVFDQNGFDRICVNRLRGMEAAPAVDKRHTVRPARSGEGLDVIIAIGLEMNMPLRTLGPFIDGAFDIIVLGIGVRLAANAQFHAVCGPG
jgi:hypothetical protein